MTNPALMQRLEGKVNFRKLQHGKAIERPGSDKGWNLVGPSYKQGNYRLVYRDINGGKIRFSNFPGYKLWLELESNRSLRIDVTGVPTGQPIGLVALTRFLDMLIFLINGGGELIAG